MPAFSAFAGTSLLLAAALVFTGCGSPRRSDRFPPPPPQARLAAQTTYLDGTVVVSAVLEPFHLIRPDGVPVSDAGARTERLERGQRPERGLGGGAGGPPPGARTNGMGGSRGPGGERRGGGMPGGSGAMRGPLRQSLLITLTNTSAHPVHLRVAEVKSVLGNSVPEPETFTLEAGGTQSLEPMRAGFRENLSELQLTLRLRTIEANETQVLLLKEADPTAAQN